MFIEVCFFARLCQNAAIIEFQKLIKLGAPVLEENLLAAFRLIEGIIQPHYDDAVQLIDFFFPQMILGHRDIRFPGDFAFSNAESHVGLSGIGALKNELSDCNGRVYGLVVSSVSSSCFQNGIADSSLSSPD